MGSKVGSFRPPEILHLRSSCQQIHAIFYVLILVKISTVFTSYGENGHESSCMKHFASSRYMAWLALQPTAYAMSRCVIAFGGGYSGAELVLSSVFASS
ncbi:unnamed protein product [Angiostrongylus costaricensis]|uniref:Secreted protein n=1 Tax=Angiostrongylus costaricensis TaxID=334426 RepID=A0A0R3PPN3_ANGCS|nr:unnamed protein product [Angiostrongylus costaricensis]